MITYAWPKNAVEIVAGISDQYGLNWDTDSNLAIVLGFIEEHCDPSAFEDYVRQCALVERGQDT